MVLLLSKAVPSLLTDEYIFLLKCSMRNITMEKPLVVTEDFKRLVHGQKLSCLNINMSNGDFLLVSKLRLF